MRPDEAIHRGVQFLEPVLTPFGFTFRLRESAPVSLSGSPYVLGVARPAFAIGEFRRDDRRIEFEFSWSLGPVTYHVGDAFIDHEAYLSALGVPVGMNRYPAVADNPLQAFRDLADDIAAYCSEFFMAEPVVFAVAAVAAATRRDGRLRRDTARAVGDDTKRAQAREAFMVGHFERVVGLLESVQYPDFMDQSDRTRLAIARRRASR
jgi:hypothetical protein